MNTLKLILQLFEFDSCLDFQAVSEEDKKIENMSAFANYRSMRKCEMKEIKSKVPFVEFRILISALNPIQAKWTRFLMLKVNTYNEKTDKYVGWDKGTSKYLLIIIMYKSIMQ